MLDIDSRKNLPTGAVDRNGRISIAFARAQEPCFVVSRNWTELECIVLTKAVLVGI